MKFAILASIPHFAAILIAAEPLTTIPASFYAFGYVPGHEKVQIRTGAETFQEVQLSTANIVGPVAAVAINGSLGICDKPLTVEGKVTHPVLSGAQPATSPD